MKKYNLYIIGMLAVCATLLFLPLRSESVAAIRDNLLWDTVYARNGIWIYKFQGLFDDSPQRISVIEIDTSLYQPEIVWPEKRTTVAATASRNDAVAAINGGFFDPKSREFRPRYPIKVDGRQYRHPLIGKAHGAVVIDHDGLLQIIAAQTPTDSAYIESQPSFLFSNPVLTGSFDYVSAISLSEPRYPRSMLGINTKGNAVMVTVDGRQKNAAGMTFTECKILADTLGLPDVILLDGGGSSTLWSRFTGVINRPSDKIGPLRIPRKVGDVILFKAKKNIP